MHFFLQMFISTIDNEAIRDIFLSQKFGHLVKPINTTWFSRFLLTKFDENKWVEISHMNKTTLYNIANQLNPNIQK